jgi:putative endonuclease
MPYTYILKSFKINNWHYVGSCNILEARFKQHKKGSVKSTKAKRPLKIIFAKEFNNIVEARKYEKYLKSPQGYLEKKKIIKNSERD